MGSSRNTAFLKRLQTELPVWVQNGWVAPEHQRSIIDHVAKRTSRTPHYLVIIFSVMGALLLAGGVISFFAANWGLIPKALKLALLGAALGGCYVGAGVCFAQRLEAVAQGLVLLGVLFFGANIFLIAQIYHIDAHYPNGVLVWAIGALVTAALAPSQLALVASLALTLLWSGLEIFVFDRNPHGPFFLPWAAALVLVYRHRWITALRVAWWVLLAWCLMTLLSPEFMDRSWMAGERVALWQVYVFAGIAIYIIARGMAWEPRWLPFTPPMITAGAVLGIAGLFALSFPQWQRFDTSLAAATVLPLAWIWATAALLVLLTGLMVWRYQDTPIATLPLYRQGAFIWLVLSGVLAMFNLFMNGRYPGWVAFGYNVLGFTGVVWLVLTGMDRGERRIVNIGFAFFAALLLARYVDTFWTLIDRSYFFMVGGIALIVAGILLERSRRRFMTRMHRTRGDA